MSITAKQIQEKSNDSLKDRLAGVMVIIAEAKAEELVALLEADRPANYAEQIAFIDRVLDQSTLSDAGRPVLRTVLGKYWDQPQLTVDETTNELVLDPSITDADLVSILTPLWPVFVAGIGA